MDSMEMFVLDIWRWLRKFIAKSPLSIGASKVTGQPSTSGLSDSVDEIRRLLMADLNPLELLNMADLNSESKARVESFGTRLVKLMENNQGDGLFSLDCYYYKKGRTRKYTRNYYAKTEYHPKRLESLMKDRTICNDHMALSNSNETQKKIDEHYEILLRNSEVDVLSHAETKMISWNIKTNLLVDPNYDTVEALLEMIDAFKPSQLFLERHHPALSKEDLEKFLSSEQVKSLSALKIFTEMALFHKFLDVKIPRMAVVIDKTLNEIGTLYLSFGEEIVQQWERKEREIDTLILLAINDGDIDIFILGDQGVNCVANQLVYGRPGSFKNSSIDSRLKLIRRDDGEGLLIVSSVDTLVFVKCDHKFRRKHGFTETAFLGQSYSVMRSQLWNLEMIEKEEKYGFKSKEPNEEVIESDIFAMFGDEISLDVDDSEKKKSTENGIDERKRKIYDEIETQLKDLIETRKKVPSNRELQIDQIWTDNNEDSEMRFADSTSRMIWEPNFLDRSLIPDDWTGGYSVLEYVEEYEKTGRILPFFDS